MRLKPGKSYIWVFLVFAAAFIILGFGQALLRQGHPEYAPALLPIAIGFVLVSEIRSRIALAHDRATDPGGKCGDHHTDDGVLATPPRLPVGYPFIDVSARRRVSPTIRDECRCSGEPVGLANQVSTAIKSFHGHLSQT
jgi:hypothetical protein